MLDLLDTYERSLEGFYPALQELVPHVLWVRMETVFDDEQETVIPLEDRLKRGVLNMDARKHKQTTLKAEHLDGETQIQVGTVALDDMFGKERLVMSFAVPEGLPRKVLTDKDIDVLGMDLGTYETEDWMGATAILWIEDMEIDNKAIKAVRFKDVKKKK